MGQFNLMIFKFQQLVLVISKIYLRSKNKIKSYYTYNVDSAFGFWKCYVEIGLKVFRQVEQGFSSYLAKFLSYTYDDFSKWSAMKALGNFEKNDQI